MTQEQRDILKAFYSNETTEEVQPNFNDVKINADNISKIVILADAVLSNSFQLNADNIEAIKLNANNIIDILKVSQGGEYTLLSEQYANQASGSKIQTQQYTIQAETYKNQASGYAIQASQYSLVAEQYKNQASGYANQVSIALSAGLSNQKTLTDITIPDNTNKVLIAPVSFTSLTIGNNSLLKII